MRRARLRVVVAAAVLLVSTGCDTAQDGGAEPTFTYVYGDYFQTCKSCHAPDAPGWVNGTEASLDFSSRQAAYASITQGSASGLVGNQEGCNGVPFLGSTSSDSLLYAVLDHATRAAFDLTSFSDCHVDTISDMTVKVGSQPSSEFMVALAQWIDDGALNN